MGHVIYMASKGLEVACFIWDSLQDRDFMVTFDHQAKFLWILNQWECPSEVGHFHFHQLLPFNILELGTLLKYDVDPFLNLYLEIWHYFTLGGVNILGNLNARIGYL